MLSRGLSHNSAKAELYTRCRNQVDGFIKHFDITSPVVALPDREAGVVEPAEKDVEKANIVNIVDECLVHNRRLLGIAEGLAGSLQTSR